MEYNDFIIEADGEQLAATWIKPQLRPMNAKLVSLHGAGTGSRSRVYYLAERLGSLGMSTFCFDFSGHGDSSGKLSESTLKRRTDQAQAAVSDSLADESFALMGNSMGGYIALSILDKFDISKLILMCPGLYATDAYDVPFDSRFTDILRRPNSFEGAHMLDSLKRYTGEVLFMIGENDDVIPERVMELYYDACPNAKSVTRVVVPEAPHQLHVWGAKTAANCEIIFNNVSEFVCRTI